MDGRTDGRTDTTSYRDATARLKRTEHNNNNNNKNTSKKKNIVFVPTHPLINDFQKTEAMIMVP